MCGSRRNVDPETRSFQTPSLEICTREYLGMRTPNIALFLFNYLKIIIIVKYKNVGIIIIKLPCFKEGVCAPVEKLNKM